MTIGLANINCSVCFIDEGNPSRHADFIVNGQSVCQKHVCMVVIDRGEEPRFWTWVGDLEEPVLEPLRSTQKPVEEV